MKEIYYKNKLTAVGNHIKLKKYQDFDAGTRTGLTLEETPDGAVLQLKAAGEGDGTWISPVIDVESPFNDLIVSWNTSTPRGTDVEVFARVYLPEYDGWMTPEGHSCSGWTDWITWGKWSTHVARNCPYQQDSHPRKGNLKSNGWVYSSSRYFMGDSSLNVRGKITASAMQLKVVFHAEEDCTHLPMLRQLTATWKNTLDPDWQSHCSYPEEPITPAKSVLLNTPAMSQMVRDPDYARVVCSATCIAMLLSGRGEDILPEDVTLANYDYGFGGNGNWSYSCAAAGEYGYESYVSYSSFESIRQELTKGYAVALSVKYTNRKKDTLPYLTNGPCRTPGHLITVVGYYFNEKLQEYVYYSNDPAAKSDGHTAHREYRQSELDKCWYRRAAYFVHDRVASAPQSARTYINAELLPAERDAEEPDKPVSWMLMSGGSRVTIPPNFLEERRARFGSHGTICYYIVGDEVSLPDTCRRVTANHFFHYSGFSVTEDGCLTFEDDAMTKLLAEGKEVKLYVINNSGTMWIADCKL